MSDDQLIAEVARIWVDSGGDEDGLSWCFDRLRMAIREEILARDDDRTEETSNA